MQPYPLNMYSYPPMGYSPYHGQMLPAMPQLPVKCSPYSIHFPTKTETLYYDDGDGEIFIFYDATLGINKVMTCIDISTLYKEKRGKAIALANFLCQLKHPNLVHIYRHYLVQETLIYIEMEAPSNSSNWKSFCKRSFSDSEVLRVFESLVGAVGYIHSMNHIHRDVHPSRLHLLG